MEEKDAPDKKIEDAAVEAPLTEGRTIQVLPIDAVAEKLTEMQRILRATDTILQETKQLSEADKRLSDSNKQVSEGNSKLLEDTKQLLYDTNQIYGGIKRLLENNKRNQTLGWLAIIATIIIGFVTLYFTR